ncbi:hypothetical protein [Mesorhizobium sp. ORS 3428]|uniref:hypothetical protein n=1 Tax=Mesorhizobium sp. ORS 3428 TaxID=540997 RepID=UPI0008DA7D04|nr:hypothetical protein [Mesorhizobium sp. ORS 3428]OHV88930.1 hypothetical protein ORS3428_17545 [Mesorhizobium sp. ORS 3428]
MHPVMTAALVACACCLVVAGSIPMLASASTPDVPDSVAVNSADKGPRVAPRSAIDSACKGQSWGHETQGCLVAILNRSKAGQQRSIRIIADKSDAQDAH